LSSDGATSHRATSLVTRTGLATRPVMFTATVATPAVAPLARAPSASNARGANATATAAPRILRAAAALKSSSSAANRGASLATRGTRREMEELAGLGGDFGARDATAGELESNFNAKSIGEADTEHMLQIPRKVCSPHTGSHTTAMAW
jgi:4a-hydroxytetrahydrobiopterin dehydratase